MCSAAADYDFFDRSFAFKARFAFAAVRAMPKLEKTLFAISINIVRNRRAAGADGFLQDLLQRDMQFPEFSARQRVGPATWAHTGTNETFIRIDVSYAVQKFLVEQRCFNRRLAAMK